MLAKLAFVNKENYITKQFTVLFFFADRDV
jgi:hypothetical protein